MLSNSKWFDFFLRKNKESHRKLKKKIVINPRDHRLSLHEMHQSTKHEHEPNKMRKKQRIYMREVDFSHSSSLHSICMKLLLWIQFYL